MVICSNVLRGLTFSGVFTLFLLTLSLGLLNTLNGG